MNHWIWSPLARGVCAVGLLAVCLPVAHAQSASPTESHQASAADANAAAPPAVRSATARLPIESFARLPLLSGVVLSPDGQRIAALLNEPERTVLITRAVAGEKKSLAVLHTDNKQYQFNWARWVNNERLLVSLRFASRRGFVRTVETRLFSVKADGSGLINLVINLPDLGSLRGTIRTQQLQDQVIDWLPDDGQHVLLQLAEAEALPAVYKVDVETGRRQMVQAPERGVRRWITDAQHRVRVGVRETEGNYEIRACGPDGKDWRVLWTFRDLGDAVWPLGFGLDPQELFVKADHQGRVAVFSVRLDRSGLPRTLRLAHPRFDIDGTLMHSPASGEVVGLRSGATDDDSGESRGDLWEPSWRGLAQSIDLGLPGRDNRLLGMSRDERRYLVYSSGNGQPGEYFLGDRRTGELALLAETYPALDPTTLAGKRPATIRARDGLNLSAYLTQPAGHTGSHAPLPLILLPHGGPQSRDDADFDSWTEFLANRGYAVLQVNFRGSDGYGREFKAAGLRRWGMEMQDDLSDAVHWAIAQRIADAKRICIVGASYGGYAALMGLVKTPELYRCAVSFAGVSDLQDLIQYERDYVGGLAAAERSIGDSWRDRERLRATSPALQAERVQAPVLLVHGTADRVVPVDQSEDMAKALRRAGKPYRFIEQEGGDHYLSRNEDRLQFFQALESFLDEHLKSTTEPTPSPTSLRQKPDS